MRRPRPAAHRLGGARRRTRACASGFDHVVCVDPAPGCRASSQPLAAERPGWLHEAFAGDDLAERCWAERWQPRARSPRSTGLWRPRRSPARRWRTLLGGRPGATGATPRSRPAACASSLSSGSARSAQGRPGRWRTLLARSYPRRGPNWSGRASGAPRPHDTKKASNSSGAGQRADRPSSVTPSRTATSARPRARRSPISRSTATSASAARRRSHEPLAADEITSGLSESERGLLGDLFAVVAEHAEAADEEIDRPTRRARLRLRLRAPRRPEAPLGRGLRQPPGRGREDLRRPAARHRDRSARRCCTTPSRTRAPRSRRSRSSSARPSPTSSTASRS